MIFISLSLILQLAFAESDDPTAEYNKKVASVAMTETQIKTHKADLKTFLKAMKDKKKILDDNGNDVTLERIVETHAALNKSILTYNDKVEELRYKYPDKGDGAERKYMPYRTQTLEEIEAEIGIDGLLTAFKKRVQKKYKAFEPEDEDDGGARAIIRQKAEAKAKQREEKPRLRLEQ